MTTTMLVTETTAPGRQVNIKQVFELSSLLRNGKTLEFIGEASTMGFAPANEIVIKHEGALKTFKLASQDKDADGDTISWTYACILSPVTIQIFND